MFQECIQQGQTKTRIYIYKWHMCPGSYNKNPEEEEEEEEEEQEEVRELERLRPTILLPNAG